MLLCKCVISCVGDFDFGFWPLDGSKGGTSGFGRPVFVNMTSSDVHSQASGGRHGSDCLPPAFIGQPFGWSVICFPRRGVEAYSGWRELGTGKSKIVESGHLAG
jgi:hypothetical protein